MPKIIEFETDPGLEELQNAVGGFFQIIPRFNKYKGRSCTAVADEEGKLKGYMPNIAAMNAWEECLPGISQHDVLVGDIAIIYGRMS